MIIDADNLKRVTALGLNAVKIMFRNELIWPVEEEQYINSYLTFSCDNQQYFYIYSTYDSSSNSTPDVYYSYDKENWTRITMSRRGSSGDYYWKSSNINFGGTYGDIYLRGYNERGFNINGDIIYAFRFVFGNSNGVILSGNLRSLTNYENMLSDPTVDFTWQSGGYSRLFYQQTQIVDARNLILYRDGNFTFWSMFSGCTNLAYAPLLPSTILVEECYLNMFGECSSLTQAPELPATTLAVLCYEGMFADCTSLTQAPELPATTLTVLCYDAMFLRCSSLTQAPELPATTLAASCYSGMFEGCSSLTQAPLLPATTLAESCYFRMFYGCKSLRHAPVLPAIKLVSYCYLEMFHWCTNLNYIKMMATNKTATYAMKQWVEGVSYSGTFVKNVNATWTTTGVDGIPRGWTVQTASE